MLERLQELVIVAVIIVVLSVLLSLGMAHCMDASPRTNSAICSMWIKHKNPYLGKEARQRIAYEVVIQSLQAELPWEVIAAIMCTESAYNPHAVGPCGELGLMQIYTPICQGMNIEKFLLFDIEYNISAGICLFLEKLMHSDGDMVQAIKRYNGTGPAADKFKVKVCRTIMDIFKYRVAQRGAILRSRRLVITHE